MAQYGPLSSCKCFHCSIRNSFSFPTFNKIYFYDNRTIWLNVPGMASIITLSCLVGVVMYAFYATCDPVKFGLIQKPDQVRFVMLGKIYFLERVLYN